MQIASPWSASSVQSENCKKKKKKKNRKLLRLLLWMSTKRRDSSLLHRLRFIKWKNKFLQKECAIRWSMSAQLERENEEEWRSIKPYLLEWVYFYQYLSLTFYSTLSLSFSFLCLFTIRVKSPIDTLKAIKCPYEKFCIRFNHTYYVILIPIGMCFNGIC